MREPGSELQTQVEGRQEVLLSEQVVEALRQRPLLRGLLAAGAAYVPRQDDVFFRNLKGHCWTVLLYCVKGAGWCEVKGHLHSVRAGDLVVLPPELPFACGARASDPWTVQCAWATGEHMPYYLDELGVSARAPVLRIGEDLQLARLFNEILDSLARGPDYAHVLLASHALAYLLASLIRRSERIPVIADAANKVAEAIIYMSDHLEQTPRVAALARLANLSITHFSALFKEQTGCSPREYLHLLRIHRACELLRNTPLQIKEIAAQLGYQDQFHFSRQFKAFEGLSPSDYRQKGKSGL